MRNKRAKSSNEWNIQEKRTSKKGGWKAFKNFNFETYSLNSSEPKAWTSRQLVKKRATWNVAGSKKWSYFRYSPTDMFYAREYLNTPFDHWKRWRKCTCRKSSGDALNQDSWHHQNNQSYQWLWRMYGFMKAERMRPKTNKNFFNLAETTRLKTVMIETEIFGTIGNSIICFLSYTLDEVRLHVVHSMYRNTWKSEKQWHNEKLRSERS